MPKVKDWGLSDTSEPDDLDAFEEYDGEDPPRGVYKFRLVNLRIKANKNDDPMVNGMLFIHDDRPEKKEYNGFGPVWFNENITDVGKPFVKRFLRAVGVEWSDLMNRTVVEGTMPKTNSDDPVPVQKIGGVNFSGNDVIVRASIGRRKGDEDADFEVKSWLPVKDDDDDIDAADGGADVEPDEPDEPDTDGDDTTWTREDLEDLSIVSDDPEVYGLAEILDEAGTEYDDTREDEEYYIALILEEEPPDDPRAAKKTTKKSAAKKTAAKKSAGKGGAPF